MKITKNKAIVLGVLLLSSTTLLTACGNNKTAKVDNKPKSEKVSKKTNKKSDKKNKKADKKKSEKVANNVQTDKKQDNQKSTQVASSNTNTQPAQTSNTANTGSYGNNVNHNYSNSTGSNGGGYVRPTQPSHPTTNNGGSHNSNTGSGNNNNGGGVYLVSGDPSNNWGIYDSYMAAVNAANAELVKPETKYDHYSIATLYYSNGTEKYALTLSTQW